MERQIKEELFKWKLQEEPLPLIVRGARQVGKTYVIENFGKENFEDVVTINFELSDRYARCFVGDLDPKRIISALEILVNRRILPGKTLLFLDEIQKLPRAITALRYFREMLPDQHVIAAGSLLEFALEDERFSFPVGRVRFLKMYPMSFSEFLKAMGQTLMIECLQKASINEPVPEPIHDRLLEYVRDYIYIGGMPSVIQSFIKTQSFLECQRIQLSLLQTYQNNFSKYAKKSQHTLLRKLFEKAPQLVGKHFKYSKFDPTVNIRDTKTALDDLCLAGLLTKVHHTSANGIPLRTQINKKKFKLLFLDVGLMQSALQIPYVTDKREISGMHHGSVAEAFSGQELLTLSDPYRDSRVYFWEREKKGSSAEVDYICNIEGKVIPIEVKAGAMGRLRSLRQFMEEKEVEIGVRISEAPLMFENGVLSLPLYMIDQLPRLIKECRA